jgi:hypothetical protein
VAPFLKVRNNHEKPASNTLQDTAGKESDNEYHDDEGVALKTSMRSQLPIRSGYSPTKRVMMAQRQLKLKLLQRDLHLTLRWIFLFLPLKIITDDDANADSQQIHLVCPMRKKPRIHEEPLLPLSWKLLSFDCHQQYRKKSCPPPPKSTAVNLHGLCRTLRETQLQQRKRNERDLTRFDPSPKLSAA